MSFNFKLGEIYLVDFDPSVGHEFKKQRPAIIIQSDNTLMKSNLVTVLALTSNIQNKLNNDILIKKNSKNKLFADSIIKVHTLHSFDKSRFIKKIGEANASTVSSIKSYLKNHFDL